MKLIYLILAVLTWVVGVVIQDYFLNMENSNGIMVYGFIVGMVATEAYRLGKK